MGYGRIGPARKPCQDEHSNWYKAWRQVGTRWLPWRHIGVMRLLYCPFGGGLDWFPRPANRRATA